MIHFITGIEDIDQEDWSSFVFNHPEGNIFQSPEYFKAVNKTNQNNCHAFFALDNQKIVGIIISNVLTEKGFILSLFSSRAVIFGAPLVKDNAPDIVDSLLKLFNSYITKVSIYSQFRNLFDTNSIKTSFYKNGFKYENHLNIIVDLDKSDKELWNNMHIKRRNEIRRAKKEGTYIKIANYQDSIECTYNILKEVYCRTKLPLPSKDYFKTIFTELGPDIFRVFVAKYEDKVIGTMYTLCYKETIYNWYAGSYVKFYNKYPNDLIPWEIFLWGKKNGFRRFDFGGAGKPDVPYGVRDYKKKFGGNLLSYGRYEKINKPFMFRVSKAGFILWRKIT
jgi:serine/alanine adding enzyme